ncbi:PREDICTED: cytochrome P450 4c3-like [Dufourea novaeangliae]|uniref:Cytochrome P450 4c3 n=1 Tax=Dufourea novaeangliae TaxID=178035 RepID=A0A154PDS3_DUFNO|nr:PREDICTED: cytochrome P450 4c3-like [Dufourea novaeangliae]KZC10045.1 Cytochrome P450 4c3 [Dufourea novaeangliae]
MGGSWITLTLAMCLMTIILLLAVRRGKFLYALRKVPYPPAFPIIGNAYQLCCSPEQAFKKMIKWGKELGDLYLIWVGMRPFIFLYKAEAIQPLLSSSVHIDKSLEYEYLQPWLGTGLVTSTGDKWHFRRKLLTPTFHSGLLEVYLKTAIREATILISCLRKEVGKPSFDIVPYAKRATLDIICDSSMGCHVNAQTDFKNEYVQAVNILASISQRRFLNVWMAFEPIFKLTTWGKQHDHALRVTHGFVNKIIAERKAEWKTKKDGNFNERITKYQALLDLLLDLSQDGEVLTDDDIRDEVNTFMFAGHDTTATSVSWILYALGRHPQYQDKILDEYNSVAGTKELSLDILNKLTWLEACIKESWRVYPVAPLIARQIYNPITILGHDIPIGSTVIVNSFLLHRDPRYFPEPDTYRPERFLPDGPKYPSYAFIPFSAGSRNCIGWKYATMIVKVLILFMLRNFRVEALDTEDQLRFISELVLHNADGLRLKISPRKLETST